MNQTRANRSSNRNYRTDASRPEMKNRRYSAADQANALGSTMPKEGGGGGAAGELDGLRDGDEERAKSKLKPDYNDLPSYMRSAATEMDRDRTRWKGGMR